MTLLVLASLVVGSVAHSTPCQKGDAACQTYGSNLLQKHIAREYLKDDFSIDDLDKPPHRHDRHRHHHRPDYDSEVILTITIGSKSEMLDIEVIEEKIAEACADQGVEVDDLGEGYHQPKQTVTDKNGQIHNVVNEGSGYLDDVEYPLDMKLVFEPKGPEGEDFDQHIALLALSGASVTMRAVTTAEKQTIVAMHNKYRCMHGAPEVIWSDDVAASAQEYVAPLTTMVHSDSYQVAPPAGPAGENLAMSSGSLTATIAIDMWYDEVYDCKTGGPTEFTDGCLEGKDLLPTGHFTAMIWKGVKEIGCAFSDSDAPTVFICRYKAGDTLSGETPNMQEHFANQVLVRTKTEGECAPAAEAVCAPDAEFWCSWFGASICGYLKYRSRCQTFCCSEPAATPEPPTPAPPPPPPPCDPKWGCMRRRRGGYCQNRRRDNTARCETAPTPAPLTPEQEASRKSYTARYVRIWPRSWAGSITTRAAVLVGTDWQVVNSPEHDRSYSSVKPLNNRYKQEGENGYPDSSYGRSMIDQVARHAWTAKHSQMGEWLEIDLGSDMDVSGVILQGKPRSGCPYASPHYLKTVKVQTATSSDPTNFQWCDDGREWNTEASKLKGEVRIRFGITPAEPTPTPPVPSTSVSTASQAVDVGTIVKTFQATGCPNPAPRTSWWETQAASDVFKDMYAYCTLTRHGGNSAQRIQCCGSDTACVASCTKQSHWIEAVDVAIIVKTFQATGCPNPAPRTSWWETQAASDVFKDMYAYCTLTRDGGGNSAQRTQCCGSDTACVSSCTKQSSWTRTEATTSNYTMNPSTGACPAGQELTENECASLHGKALGEITITYGYAGEWSNPETCGCYRDQDGSVYFNKRTVSCDQPEDGEMVICVKDPTIATTPTTATTTPATTVVPGYEFLGNGICKYTPAGEAFIGGSWTISPCTIDRCKQLCDQSAGCTAFNWNPSGCQCARNKVSCSLADLLKSSPWQQDNSAYVKQAAPTFPALEDNDYCLQQSPSWGSSYVCSSSTTYCINWAKDMQRCCPVSCGTDELTESECNALSSKGTCAYPLPQATRA